MVGQLSLQEAEKILGVKAPYKMKDVTTVCLASIFRCVLYIFFMVYVCVCIFV